MSGTFSTLVGPRSPWHHKTRTADCGAAIISCRLLHASMSSCLYALASFFSSFFFLFVPLELSLWPHALYYYSKLFFLFILSHLVPHPIPSHPLTYSLTLSPPLKQTLKHSHTIVHVSFLVSFLQQRPNVTQGISPFSSSSLIIPTD
ncbi:hypothetical protein BCV70DRAFT_23703 [Testicularia cyperi]|uniref:Uncharacterized protein n=1 Tax=Testicularia cyperi TaxID=1882483 RepID=A0A317XZY5_9BASI|nr:hypothetical protein BCV70DRAFT_23703 [Testicularia cyperi]